MECGEERKKKPFSEMSAWERRKQYWQNLCTPAKTAEGTKRAATQGNLGSSLKKAVPRSSSAAPGPSTERPKSVTSRAVSQPPPTKRPRVVPLANKAAPKKSLNVAAQKKAVAPAKRKSLVADCIQSKRVKTDLSRRATINTTETALHSRKALRHRLTDFKSLENNSVTASAPLLKDDPNITKKRRVYHHIPSRIESGLKKKPARATCNPERTGNFKRPHTPFGPAAAVTTKPRDRRSSFTISKNDINPQTPDKVEMPNTSGTAQPHSERRGSYTISTGSDSSIETLGDKMFDAVTDTKNEIDFEAGNLGNTPRPIRRESFTISTEGKEKHDPKEVIAKGTKSPVVVKVPRRKGRASVVSTSDKNKSKNGRAAVETKAQAETKIGRSKSISTLPGGKMAASKVSVIGKRNAPVVAPRVQHGPSARTSKPSGETRTKARENKIAKVTPAASLSKPDTDVKTAENVTKILPKTPKSAMKKGSSRVVKSLNFASNVNENDDVFSDAENIPPPNMEMITPDASGIARSKRSKSVSFQVGLNDGVCVTLPKTPRREPSLRQKLENFMEEKGYSVSKHRHLHCFGFELSNLKMRRPSTSRGTRASLAPTSPGLKARESTSKPKLPATPASASGSDDQEKATAILNDLKTLLLLGQPLDEGEEWMCELEKTMLPTLETQALYWVVKALLAEQAKDYHKALEIFTKAVDEQVQPASELLSALQEFMARIPEASVNQEESSVVESGEEPPTAPVAPPRRKKGRKANAKLSEKKPKRDYNEMFESTVIKYTIRDSSTLNNLNKILNISSPKVLAVVTPVRRSRRLSRSAKKRTSFNLNELPRPLRERVIQESNAYL